MQIRTKIISCHTANTKPVKREINSTVIHPSLVFPGGWNRTPDLRITSQWILPLRQCPKINFFLNAYDFDFRPALIVIRDTNGHRFGAFVNEAFRISENSFGSGETFVFRIREGEDGLQVESFDSGKELIILFCSEIDSPGCTINLLWPL